MIHSRRKHVIDAVFPVILSVLFTFCAVCLLILSIRFYQSTVERAEKNENLRVAVSYVREVLRQNSGSARLEVQQWEDGSTCLALPEEDGEYATYLYLEQGMLKELYAKVGAQVDWQDGQDIIELQTFYGELEDDLLNLTCVTADGRQENLVVYLSNKTGEEGQDGE